MPPRKDAQPKSRAPRLDRQAINHMMTGAVAGRGESPVKELERALRYLTAISEVLG